MVSTPRESGARLILASASTARAAMLRAAAVEFTAIPAAIDEAAIKRHCRDRGKDAPACAMALALAKARAIAAKHPDAIIIGADQILVTGDQWFDKPADLAEAAAQIRRLSGRTHILATAACAVRGDASLWTAAEAPKLTMRHIGESFLHRYIEAEGEAVLGSVGAYRIEGRGAQLFSRIEGDHFSILGLPLLALLGFLRGRGLLGE
jgi:septum formation protein